MQDETVNSMVGLTWMAIKKVFSKPIIFIAYMMFMFLFWMMYKLMIKEIYYVFDGSFSLSYIIVYLVIILSLSFSYNFSLLLLRSEAKSILDIVYVVKPSLFFKTILFISASSIKFIIPFTILCFLNSPFGLFSLLINLFSILTSINIPGVLIFIMILVLSIIIVPAIVVLFLVAMILPLYWHVKGIMTVPYGVLGEFEYSRSYHFSAESIKGINFSICLYFILLSILFLIATALPIVTNSFLGLLFLTSENGSESFFMSGFSAIISPLILSIYFTTINLLYMKIKNVVQNT
jgi:hypothetical protein